MKPFTVWVLRGFFVIIMVAPIFIMIESSLTPGTVMETVPATLTLAHYQSVFSDPTVRAVFVNTALISISSAITVIILALPAAYAFSRYRFFAKEWIFLSLLIVWVVPQILVAIPFFVLFADWFLINKTWVLAFFAVLQALPLSTWMLRGYLESIPRELDEAALVDGAGLIRALGQVILPVAFPCVMAVGLYTVLLTWELFLYPLVFISDAAKQLVGVGVYTYVGQFSTSFTDMMAYSFVMSVPVFAAFLLTQRYLIAGLTAGIGKS